MHFLPRSRAIASLSIVALFLVSGCGASKVAQCNSMIEVANSAVEAANKLTTGGGADDPQVMLEAADAMEQASSDMQALELEDESLQEYRTGFVEMYDETSSATRALVEAVEAQDREAADTSLTDLQNATQSEQELVNGVNSYCQG